MQRGCSYVSTEAPYLSLSLPLLHPPTKMKVSALKVAFLAMILAIFAIATITAHSDSHSHSHEHHHHHHHHDDYHSHEHGHGGYGYGGYRPSGYASGGWWGRK